MTFSADVLKLCQEVIIVTFGQAIKHLLHINHIKMGVLANVLGYDTSYLSKWVSEAKLPSAKCTEALCDKIAIYVKSISTLAMQAETAAKLLFDIYDSSVFEKILSDRLYTIYLEQKEEASYNPQSDNNANLVYGWVWDAKKATEEITEFYRKSDSAQAEGILSLPHELLFSDFIQEANLCCLSESSSKKLHFRQIISIQDFSGDIDMYIRYILKHLSLLLPIQIDYYSPASEDSVPSQNPLFLLKNHISLQGICSPFIGENRFSAITRNPSTVSELYCAYNTGFQMLVPQIERLDIYDSLSYSFAIQHNNRYIMPYMGPVLLGEDFLDEFLEKYLDVPEMYEYHRKMHQMVRESEYSLITYVSTLIDYINSGRIRLFDGVVTVTREDRKRHLKYLLEKLEAQSGFTIKILNDRNPILSREDNRLTLYLNENATFAGSDAPSARSELFNFVSPKIKQQINAFFSHLESLPESYLKCGKTGVDFIYSATKLI